VSIIAFADRILDVFPLTRGKGRILSLLSFLERLACHAAATDLAATAAQFVHRKARHGLAILLSDLYDPAGFQRGVDVLRHHRYEPHLVQVYDPAEADPNLLGDLELQDVESGRTKKVTVTERNLRTYRKVFERFLRSVESYCLGYGLACTRTSTEVPFDELILQMARMAGTVG